MPWFTVPLLLTEAMFPNELVNTRACPEAGELGVAAFAARTSPAMVVSFGMLFRTVAHELAALLTSPVHGPSLCPHDTVPLTSVNAGCAHAAIPAFCTPVKN
jgi:hypothetical protein